MFILVSNSSFERGALSIYDCFSLISCVITDRYENNLAIYYLLLNYFHPLSFIFRICLLTRDRLQKEHFYFLLRLSLILIYISSLFSCVTKYISIDQVENIEYLKINRIAIVPFTTDRMHSNGVSETAAEGAATLTRLMEKKLDRFYYLITREKVAAVLSETKSLSVQQIATILGRKLEVDAVLTGLVNRYQLRKGNNYSVSQPASVAFEIYLLDSKKGKTIWSASFDKTQKSLSEDLSNIFSFIQGEWRWLTAEELMELGVNQIIDKFPGMRERKEQKKLKPLRSPWPLDMG